MNLLKFLSRIKKFLTLSMKERTALVEAFCISGLVRFAILFIQFRKLVTFLGKYREETTTEVANNQMETIARVTWAVQKISDRTPWQSKCLVKALTAQLMLARRKISSTLYLGVAKDENNRLLAHAWLRSGKMIITGARECAAFKEVGRFANYAGGDR